jgi:hypothetical protein
VNEKKGFYLRWPWNVVVYVLLFVVLRIFAIPVVLLLMSAQRRNNPNGAAEGYCLSRTRKRLTWLLWALLAWGLAVSLGAVFFMGLEQDRAYWETADYVTLAVSGGGAALFLLLGLWLGYAALRDTFFPAKSALAQSIRSQLPYPDEAPPVDELFAMVDNDLKEDAHWFGPVGIGREWVLGDGANRIDRIRGIFLINELHQHQTQTGVRTSREMALVLIDDRWQRTGTSFNSLSDLQAAVDCLALRVPDAARGGSSQCTSFWTMDESAQEEFERDFRQKQSRRASSQLQQEAGGTQDMILASGGDVTSRVTLPLAETHLRRCLAGETEGFTLTPTRPIEGGGRSFRALRVEASEGRAQLVLELAGGQEGLMQTVSPPAAQGILAGWLRHTAPELAGWAPLRLRSHSPRQAAPNSQPSQARLSLVYASGAAENHTTFTTEDVQAAADGIVSGEYQLVDLTHPVGYLWIRVTAGDQLDGRCTVEATRPEKEQLQFYTAKMPPREAAAWLTGYPHGQFLPGGRDWKRIKKNKKESN